MRERLVVLLGGERIDRTELLAAALEALERVRAAPRARLLERRLAAALASSPRPLGKRRQLAFGLDAAWSRACCAPTSAARQRLAALAQARLQLRSPLPCIRAARRRAPRRRRCQPPALPRAPPRARRAPQPARPARRRSARRARRGAASAARLRSQAAAARCARAGARARRARAARRSAASSPSNSARRTASSPASGALRGAARSASPRGARAPRAPRRGRARRRAAPRPRPRAASPARPARRLRRGYRRARLVLGLAARSDSPISASRAVALLERALAPAACRLCQLAERGVPARVRRA